MASSIIICSKSAQTLTSRCFSCHGNRAAGTRPIPNFSSTMNPQLNGITLCEISFYANLFWQIYADLPYGNGFLWNTVYISVGATDLQFWTENQIDGNNGNDMKICTVLQSDIIFRKWVQHRAHCHRPEFPPVFPQHRHHQQPLLSWFQCPSLPYHPTGLSLPSVLCMLTNKIKQIYLLHFHKNMLWTTQQVNVNNNPQFPVFPRLIQFTKG